METPGLAGKEGAIFTGVVAYGQHQIGQDEQVFAHVVGRMAGNVSPLSSSRPPP